MSTLRLIFTVITVLTALGAQAQSKAYQRKKPAAKAAPAVVPAAKPAPTAAKAAEAAPAKADSEKLDIQDLEQKYWAPKDTDFSVVQNRTYTKAGRVAASLMTGPIVNDTFNEGLTTALNVSYYFDERYGVEFMYQSSDLEDSQATKKFRSQLSGGAVSPDYNRDVSFYGVGFNWVPFYAKMSFLGRKIIYFDMQVTPVIGMSTYEQQSEVKTPEESSFSYGVDVTQFFFFSDNVAVRGTLHNRFYSADVLGYQSGAVTRTDSTTTTMFLVGLTYFF
jgi:outer membrane beta-barrel protein